MTLRTKTFSFLFTFVILIIIIVKILGIQFLKNSHRKSVYNELERVSASIFFKLSEFLDDTLRDTESIASSLPLKALEDKNISVIEEYLKSKFAIYSKFENGLFILDKKGNLWVDYPPHPAIRGKNFAHQEYFKTTMEKQRGIIGIPYQSTRTKEPVLTFTALLRDSKNRIIGLLGCSVKLLKLNELESVKETKIGKGGYIYIFDPSGLMILHPKDSKILQQVVSPVILKKVNEGFEGVGELISEEGFPVLFSMRRIPKVNWIVVSEQPKSEAFSSFYETRRRILIVGLIILVTSAGICIYIAYILTKPLVKFREAVLQFSSDPELILIEPKFKDKLLETLKGVTSSNEIGDLARAFKVMCEKLYEIFIFLKKTLDDWVRTFDSVNDPIFLLDKDHRILRLNKAARELIGMRYKEVFGEPCYKYIHGTKDPPDFCPHRKTLTTGVPSRKEIDEPLLNGVFEITTTPVIDEDKNIIGTVHLMKNITEQKRSEESLRASEERYKTLVENLSDGIILLDKGGMILSYNQSFCRLFGFEKEEIEGKSINILYSSKESFSYFERLAYPLAERNGSFRTEWYLIHKNGEEVPVEIIVTPIKSKEGFITGYVNIFRDISERKQMEKEKAYLEEQLRHSQKMEAIGRLAGGIAHDFNNLLTVIHGYCDISLFELPEGNPIRQNIEQIKATSKKASDLTRQLLTFSRRQSHNPIVLDLNAIVNNLEKMLRRIIGEDIELIKVLSENLGRVRADQSQIEQVILNLAVNARDAMSKGGKLIIETANIKLDETYCKTHLDINPGEYVLLSVTDTGMGMPPEVKEKIFEPFFTTKEKGKGTGLGLSIVYGIVKQSGGNIWVYSEPGKGTTFKIYFPRIDQPFSEVQEREITEVSRGHETILVVEDDENVRVMVTRILTTLGYRVLNASDANEALGILRDKGGSIALVITDMIMPSMNGQELTDHLRQIHPHLKVLYMSGYTDITVHCQRILEDGVNFIQKPFTLDSLAKKVRDILDLKEINPVLPSPHFS